MQTIAERTLRSELAALLVSSNAHVDFSRAVANFPPALRAKRPRAVPWSAWQLIEHMRIAQHDILKFCLHADYQSPSWPDDYWPKSPTPPTSRAWADSARSFVADRDAFVRLIKNRKTDLFSPLHGRPGYTILREALLAADHCAYHLGEIILVRRLLGVWPD